MPPRTASTPRATTSLALLAGGLAAALALLAGCPGTLDDPDRFKVDASAGCSDVPTTLLLPKCGTASGCHTADAPASGLDLASSGVAARVAGVAATAACGGGLLADPADPAGSILYLKVTETTPCGSRMPLGADPLGADEQQCLLDWIAGLGAGGGAAATTTGAGGGGGAGGAGVGGSGGMP